MMNDDLLRIGVNVMYFVLTFNTHDFLFFFVMFKILIYVKAWSERERRKCVL